MRPRSSGSAQTEYSKDSGRSELQLACEAVRAAIRDAGLKPREVDGMTTFTMDTSDEIEVARAVGIGELTLLQPHAARRRRRAAASSTRRRWRWRPASAEVRRLLPRAQRALRPALQPGRPGRHRDQRPDPLELVHALRAADAGLVGGDVHAALHARDRLHEQDSGRSRSRRASTRSTTRTPSSTASRSRSRSTWRRASIVEPLRLYDCCQETDGGCASSSPRPSARATRAARRADPRRRAGGRPDRRR